MIDDEQGSFRVGRGYVNQIFTLKQERKNTMYIGFIDLEKVYDRVNRETLWQVLKIHDVGVNC